VLNCCCFSSQQLQFQVSIFQIVYENRKQLTISASQREKTNFGNKNTMFQNFTAF